MPDFLVPNHASEQVALYQTDHLLTHPVVGGFDPELVQNRATTRPEVIAIDLGGDKLRIATYTQSHDRLTLASEVVHRVAGGAGYLDILRYVAEDARIRRVPVGISAAVRLEGSVVVRTTNLQSFHQDLDAGYGSDFRRLFDPATVVVNDTAAGIVGAAIHLTIRSEQFRNIAFFICGSGLGASVIDGDTVVHVEAAHVPLVDALNPLQQTVHCHVDGKDFVCLERVTAMRAGIELLHESLTGERVSAENLAMRADAGEKLPDALFETSATALAHAVAGVVERYGFVDDTTIVLHGGAFESVSYRYRLIRRLKLIPMAAQPRVVFARDLSDNICLDGAAWLAGSSDDGT